MVTHRVFDDDVDVDGESDDENYDNVFESAWTRAQFSPSPEQDPYTRKSAT